MTRSRKSAPRTATEQSTDRFRCDDDDYHRWRTGEVGSGAHAITVSSKPGVPGFGEADPATGLLLDHVEIGAGESVCDLHCGPGAVGVASALRTSGAVSMCDVNLLSVAAARRTVEASGASASVTFGRAADALGAERVDVAVVRLAKGRIPTLRLMWDAYHALRPGGRCYLAGANDEGVRTALRQLEQLFGDAAVLGYRGGNRVGMAIRPDAAPERTGDFDVPWLDPGTFHELRVEACGVEIDVRSRPGVFSWDRLDDGTRALLDVLNVQDAGAILDLGCGFGIVGAVAARLAPAARVTLTDVSMDAIESSRRTIAENGLAGRCEVIASDIAAVIPDRSVDLVLTNPPFHTGKATDLLVAAQFVRDAARVLKPGGRLMLVANRTLPYELWLRACFGSYHAAFDGRRFKVLSAVRPG
ncbi:MAG TPA: methyltransferase [Longimicrobiales bacterium]|nr:methyltransferase [Longimicrobiales bacterium]